MGNVDRAEPADLAFLAMDRPGIPYHVAAVLLLDAGPGFDPAAATALLRERSRAVPRLRQRLVAAPLGCGRPYWVDDDAFDVQRHVRHIACTAPADEERLLAEVTDIVTTPLPRTRPLWSVTYVTGLPAYRVAMVVVLHHAVADGIGGLAVLAALADGGAPADPSPPARRLARGRLAADAWAGRLRSLRRAGDAWRDLRAAMSTGGGWLPPPAAPCSLLGRTGPRRRLAVVRADLQALRARAHRFGGTVNDAVLAAVAEALRRTVEARGERLDGVNVAVPVAGRRATTARSLGNRVAPLLVAVPAAGDPARRVARVAAATRAGKAAAGGPAPITVLGPVFRAAARLGAYRWYQRHQRRIHTLVSTVRGPERPLYVAGARVAGIVPIAVAEAGNVTVTFVALSYAGTLTITVVADPEHVPDLSALTGALAAELDGLAGAGCSTSVGRYPRPRGSGPAGQPGVVRSRPRPAGRPFGPDRGGPVVVVDAECSGGRRGRPAG